MLKLLGTAAAVLITVITWMVYDITRSREQHRVVTAQKEAWFNAHKCQRIGYVGTAYRSTPARLYKCDDGLQYIWDDIPAEAP